MPKVVTLDSIEKFEALVGRSSDEPVFLLKHSRTCGISADIYEQMGSIDGEMNVIVVQDHRAGRRAGVRGPNLLNRVVQGAVLVPFGSVDRAG